ncbi:Lateral Root Primordium type 1, C-terminal [Cynara cardunculus var. scolymus]|uniref:Lateral Root Primordium type 1, C-terminal n=1 Tax=Cynara cardunculus var. scolymus TaxID=59895 RepID=A0A103XLZ1_CYNCS|nr:Lateral Root Primordium type 1, C-terminal [Cynara cardunculus var. scolymus]
MRCQECGNKAKRDCLYYRCRSCCKGRGFECETHVKSTWAPASSTKHQVSADYSTHISHHHQEEEEQHGQQLHLPSSSSDMCFPTKMVGESTFTCVRVTSTSEENAIVDQYAYETSINIGGHVFKGILYDQGPSHQMMNFQDRNADGGDQQNSTINIQSDSQPLDKPRPSSPPDFSFDIYPHIK